MEEYKTLRDEDAFTDLEIVAGRGRAQTCRRRIHSVVMAASSDFLGHWMEQVLPFPTVSNCRTKATGGAEFTQPHD